MAAQVVLPRINERRPKEPEHKNNKPQAKERKLYKVPTLPLGGPGKELVHLPPCKDDTLTA